MLTLAELRALPADPTVLRILIDSAIRESVPGRDEPDGNALFDAIGRLLAQPVEPAVRQVLFGMLTRIDGVQTADDLDLVGRPVIAVMHPNTVRMPGTVERLLYSRDKHEPMGEDHGITVGKPCSFLSRSAIIASGWVDHLGDTVSR